MDKSMVKGLVVGGIATVVLSTGAVTGYRVIATPRSADVRRPLHAGAKGAVPQLVNRRDTYTL